MESCVRGYHIFQTLWTAIIGEDLECRQEHGNPTDAYAVAVIKMSLSLVTYLS